MQLKIIKDGVECEILCDFRLDDSEPRAEAETFGRDGELDQFK